MEKTNRAPGGRDANKFRRPKNTKAAIGRIFSYMSGYRMKMVLVVIGIILFAGTNIMGTYL